MFSREEALAELQRRGAYNDIGGAPQAAPQPEVQDSYRQPISQAQSFAQGGLDTLTFGALPKVSGALGTAIARTLRPELFENESAGQTYEKSRDYLREQNNMAAQDNPWSYGIGGVAGALLNPVGRGVNTVKGAAGLGAGYGAAYGLGSSDKGEVGSIGGENLMDALQSGFLGGAFGAMGQGLINKAIVPGYRALSGSKLNPFRGNVMPSEALPESFNMNTQAAASEAIPSSPPIPEFSALPKDKFAQKAVELGKQFNVPVSQGQATQDFAQQSLEDLIASGAKGAEPAAIANAQRAGQREAFQTAAQNLRRDIGGGEFVEKGQSLQPLIDKVVGEAKSGDKAVNEAYDLAKNSLGYLDIKDIKGFNKVAKAKFVEEALTPENAPGAHAQLRAFRRIFSSAPDSAKEVDFRRIEAYRQGLNRSYSAAQGQDKYGIKLLKDQLDDYLNNTIETALVRGDPAVLDKFLNARQYAAQVKSRFTARDKTEFGKKFIQDVVENSKNSREPLTPAMISDKIWGASKYGFKKESESIINELKKQVGEDSPLLNGLKLDATQKVIKPLINNRGEFNFNAPAVQSFKNNLYEQKTYLKNILKPEEFKKLSDLGDLGTVLFQSRKSVVNPPQTGLFNAISEAPFIKQALSIGGKVAGLPLIKEIPEAYNVAKAKAAFDPRAVEASITKLAPSSPIPSSEIAPSTALGATATIDNLLAPEKSAEETVAMSPKALMIFNRDEAIKELERRKQLQQPPTPDMPASPEMMPEAPAPRLKSRPQRMSVIDDEFLRKVAQIESGGNPNARATGGTASGMYQFTNGTWRNVVNKYGADTGITLKDKNNPEAQAIMVQRMMEDHAPVLRKILGHEPSYTDLYLTHFLGLGGAKKMLNAKVTGSAAAVLPDAARSNKALFYSKGRPLTVAQFYNRINKKVMSA